MKIFIYFLILLLSLSLVVDVDADWKFWKKKNRDKDEPESAEAELSNSSSTPISTSTTTTTTTTTTTSSTTVAPTTATSSSGWKFWKKKKDEPTSTVSPKISTTTRTTPTPRRGSAAPTNTANRGIAAAADPALAIGVGSVGDKIKEDARNQPRRPNPGTEVGLDFPQPKPARPGFGSAGAGQGNRDWPDDLTILSEPGRQSPKLPAQGPTGPLTGNRPASVPAGTPLSQQTTPAPGARPVSVHSNVQPTASPNGKAAQPSGITQPTPVTSKPSTPASSAKPTPAVLPGKPAPAPVALPGRPTPAPATPTKPTTPAGSPTGSRTWAEIAGGGSSKSGSPTPAARPGLATPGRSSAQQPVDLTAQGNNKPAAAAAAQPSTRPGSGAAAVAGGVALAGAGIDNNKPSYSSNPSFSKGKEVTDEDLEKLSEALFIKDTNNAFKYIKMNLQKQIQSGSTKDEAPEPLLEVKPEALQIPTIQRVLSIHDNYKLDTRVNEYISPAQRQEESQLVDTFLSTNVMSSAMRFLADKGFLKKDYYEYKDALRTLWFNLYSRGGDGKIGSTGFEHVFLSELKLGTEVSGLHNWIYFNAEELKKRAEYLGYVKKLDLGSKAAIIKMPMKFNGIDRPVTSMFIGTSPELEMALYSVCFYARPEAACPVSLGGAKFNIITHKFRYRGREHIGTAYPEI